MRDWENPQENPSQSQISIVSETVILPRCKKQVYYTHLLYQGYRICISQFTEAPLRLQVILKPPQSQ